MSIGPGRGLDNGEDDEEDVAVGVGQGSEPIVLFLSSGIPQSEVDHAPIDLDSGGIVVKDGRNVLSGELILSIAR